MRRLLLVAGLVGAVNGVVAVVVLRALDRGAPSEFGWFAYAPLEDLPATAVGTRPDWWPALLLLPVVLAALTATLALVADRRGWLR